MALLKLDFKGMMCPMPIMKLSLAVRKGQPGDTFEITCDDPAFEPDVKAWCNETGNVLNSINKTGRDFVASITKK